MGHALLAHKKEHVKHTFRLQEALASATVTLRGSGVDSPRLEAEVLMAKSLGISRSQLCARLQEPVEPRDLKDIYKLVKKRARRIPLQYLTGHAEFMSLDFLMKRGILVPRQETELAVEAVLKLAARRPADTGERLRILDIGTGCGCIAVSIAVGLGELNVNAEVYASDMSSRALKLARLNAVRHKVEDKLSFHKGPVYQAFKGLGLEGEIHFIVSNPPYVPAGEWQDLPPEVRDYEDPRALVAGDDGLDCYRIIVAGARNWLRPGGRLIMELGEGQATAVKRLLEDGHLTDVETIKDLRGVERIIIARPG
ncbi:MAG: peptide chain release factor N(5)-glutamine methyltransferase [Planctomycetes bacterium]|nr:peptide chain release factor N(5)-glutamine methyltransferase [Planctomycetota bacterium]